MLFKTRTLIPLISSLTTTNMSSTTKSVLNNNIEILLQEVAKAEGFCKYEIKSGTGSVKGDGYTGIIISICITGEDKTKKDKVLHLVVKNAPMNQALRENIPLVSAFEREIYMYSTVFPALHALEIEKDLPISYFAPQYYKGSLSLNNETIVLENLRENGYVMYNAQYPMNEEHISLVLTKYARLHALSFAMQDQKINKFRKIVEPLEDILIKFLLGDFVNTLVHRCTKAQESLDPEVDRSVIQLYKNFLSEIPNYLKHLLEERVEECSVILHGDCWCNNMMFKYYVSILPLHLAPINSDYCFVFQDIRDLTKPSDVRLLDFQTSKVESPALDLCYFLYSCGSKEVLDKLDYFMQLYHGKLSEFVTELGSDPEKLFSYRILKEHWKKYAKFGLILCASTIHAMLTEREEAIDLGHVAESEGSVSNAFNYEIKNVDEYNNRLKNIILHFYQHGLL